MPDSKITALASTGTGTDPANDPLVIVDVSDTSMAATGTTKKVTLNQLLACSPTATLASATITGDLTVATNRLSVSSTGVQIGTTTNKTTAFTGNGTGLTIGAALAPTIALWDTTNASYVGSISQIDADMYLTNTAVGQMVFSTDNTSRYTISSTGVATWSNVGGVAGTAMTLNSTGLGVGGAPLTNNTLSIYGAAFNDTDAFYNTTFRNSVTAATSSPKQGITFSGLWNANAYATFAGVFGGKENATSGNYAGSLAFWTVPNGGNPTTRMLIDSSGNVGIGVTPSYRLTVQGSDNSIIAQFGGTNRQVRLSTSAISAVDNASFNFIHTSGSGRFTFQNNSGTQTMLTIDDNGNNILRMPVTPPTLGVNLEGTFNLTSNTNLRISVRGSDGVTRVANITLA